MTPTSSQVRMRWQRLSVSWGRLGHCTCTSLAGSNSTSTGFVDVEEAAATSAVVPAKLSVLAFDAMVLLLRLHAQVSDDRSILMMFVTATLGLECQL